MTPKFALQNGEKPSPKKYYPGKNEGHTIAKFRLETHSKLVAIESRLELHPAFLFLYAMVEGIGTLDP